MDDTFCIIKKGTEEFLEQLNRIRPTINLLWSWKVIAPYPSLTPSSTGKREWVGVGGRGGFVTHIVSQLSPAVLCLVGQTV